MTELRVEDYLHWCIDRIKPLTLDFQIKVWSERGYIEEGYTSFDKMPDFETWKRIYPNRNRATSQ